MDERRYRLALQLGWVMASLYGRLTQPNIRWRDMFARRSNESVPRLFISTREPNHGDSVWADCISLTYLLNQLYLSSDSHSEAMSQQLLAISTPPESIKKFISEADKALWTRSKLTSRDCQLDTLLHDLNYWSRKVWSTLNAEESALSDFASLGAGLSDMFWQWRLQSSQPKSRQTFKRLFNRYRLTMMVKRTRRLKDYMPEDFSPCLINSIYEWSNYAEENLDIKGQAEKALKKTFKKQLQVWEELVFQGYLAYRLKSSDLLLVNLLSVVTYSCLLVLVVVIFSTSLYLVISIANFFLTEYLSFGLSSLRDIEQVEDKVKLVASIVTAISLLLAQLGRISRFVGDLYSTIYSWFYLSKLIQRTCISPRGRAMPIAQVWYKMVTSDVL
ncbi:hypothetical protein [cf. Phormidesmis sp. LEGE 11477]|uniref:hypothetical protein n=1 Tax=cf. Phormidesmis sp. LEGE 11477 TaxID=1828680 RepID=UPI001880E59E|nr:hypothetical protein [cf. Phormidesmis sp. LEGE 11477]MBE9063386.1 hypothetical protein [cf. Phormidesmis sp. LEGE 11477]